MVVLDGIHRLHPSTVTVLQRLAQDRETTLSDGTVMVPEEKFSDMQQALGLTAAEMHAQGNHPARWDSGEIPRSPLTLTRSMIRLFTIAGVREIKASFRMVALSEALPGGSAWRRWLEGSGG